MAQRPPRPTGSSGGPDRRDLVDAYQNLVKSEQDRQAAEQHGRPQPEVKRRWLGLGLGLILACAAILYTKPAWLFTPPPPPEPPALQEASIKLAIYRAAMRIDAFLRSNGRLPETAAEAGAQVAGTVYAPAEDHYTITATSGSHTVTYDSRTPLTVFLGDSYDLIKQRGRS